MRLALYQPDIPQNTGTLMRLCACLGIGLDIIEPCGFILSDKNIKRASMDYVEYLEMARHSNWEEFKSSHSDKRLILMSTKAEKSFIDFKFKHNDILIAGRESAGVPDSIYKACNDAIKIPMIAEVRSINIAVASSIILGEALRQTNQYPYD